MNACTPAKYCTVGITSGMRNIDAAYMKMKMSKKKSIEKTAIWVSLKFVLRFS